MLLFSSVSTKSRVSLTQDRDSGGHFEINMLESEMEGLNPIFRSNILALTAEDNLPIDAYIKICFSVKLKSVT